jgi:hypothetical protein
VECREEAEDYDTLDKPTRVRTHHDKTETNKVEQPAHQNKVLLGELVLEIS